MCFSLATWFPASSDEESESEELFGFAELFGLTEFFGLTKFFYFTTLFDLEHLFSLDTLLKALQSLRFLLRLTEVEDEASPLRIFFVDSRVTSRGC